MRKNNSSFTLIEIIVVIIIIGIIAGMGVPGFMKTKYNVLSKEAVSNIKLIAAAEKIYKMESSNNAYMACSSATNCNSVLKLDLTAANWQYRAQLTGGVITIYATLASNPNCYYTLSSSNFNAAPQKSSGCPAGME